MEIILNAWASSGKTSMTFRDMNIEQEVLRLSYAKEITEIIVQMFIRTKHFRVCKFNISYWDCHNM